MLCVWKRVPVLKGLDQGWSMLEVLASMLIILLLFAPISTFFGYCTLVYMKSRQQTQALFFAQEILESLKANSEGTSILQNPGVYVESDLSQWGLISGSRPGCTPRLELQWEDAERRLCQAKVEVYWKVKQEQYVQLITFIQVSP